VLKTSRAEAVVLAALLATLLAALGVMAIQRARSGGAVKVSLSKEDVQHRIDLNSASEPELLLIPGIGPARARKVVEHRTRQGRFSMVDELANVDGFTPKLVEQVRPFLCVRDSE